jgi:hypothetical protein
MPGRKYRVFKAVGDGLGEEVHDAFVVRPSDRNALTAVAAYAGAVSKRVAKCREAVSEKDDPYVVGSRAERLAANALLFGWAECERERFAGVPADLRRDPD